MEPSCGVCCSAALHINILSMVNSMSTTQIIYTGIYTDRVRFH